MNIFPLITKYEKAINYDDPNETYLINVLYDELASAIDVNNLEKGVYSFASPGICKKNNSNCNADNIFNDDYYKKLLVDHMKAKNMLVYKGVADVIDTWKNNYMSRGMREFFKYSKNRFEVDTTMKILIEFQNGNFAKIEC